MDSIRQALQAIDAAQQQLHQAVHTARAQGHSWAEIGTALGVSRQAAFKRFGKPVNPYTGEPMPARPTSTITTLTEKLFNLINEGDWEKVTELIHPEDRAELSPEVIRDAWIATASDYGTFTGCHDTIATTASTKNGTEPLDGEITGLAVGVTTLRFEAGEYLGRVAFDRTNLIKGIYIVPTDATETFF
ncbi:hypothetical protein [Corynebacterium lowii]|uniref:DUF3887 domain-containing protein n=1 Tax=Corynebacterium lowii TaxID=1544413 RepID=A0A0Q0U2C1_9CORY|nr:hypothetical protein [Corynebacterium lowii]KQB86000.1 hypothetical protein Clow_01742 [Corynebacterium lowii]MDP9850570.1 hypothetical protein [Corynebacterium lowii]